MLYIYMITKPPILVKVADEAWMALALLHRENPERDGFSAREISEKVRVESVHPEPRPGIQPHISLHNVANIPANSARYRMFYRMEDGRYRLYRPGDDFDASRTGKTAPQRQDLPEEYRDLLDWYENSYCNEPVPTGAGGETDPFLRMRAVGREIWSGIDADHYVEQLRSVWDQSLPDARPQARAFAADPDFANDVWGRVLRHQGENFTTKRGLPFRYEVEGSSGIWFYREGKRIEQRLSRGELEKALREIPLSSPTDIKELRDPSYLYGLLVDSRIVGDL